MSKNTIVSICMITYNHENFIREAIEGVLMQKTTFPIELIIGEDCSTDKTRHIVREYAEKYPEIIRPLLPEKNLGVKDNFIQTLQACTGKYIALCEGDDYWIDPYKLQKQVDFLEANEDFSICFHNVKILEDGILVDDFITRQVPDITSIKDLARGNYIHTPSVVFRKNQLVLDEFKEIQSPIGDYVLHMLNAKYGKIKKLNELMGVYRHSVGIWSSKDEVYRIEKTIEVFEILKPHFDLQVNDIFQNVITNYYNQLIIQFKDNMEKSNEYYLKQIENNPFYLSELISYSNKYQQINIKKTTLEYNVGHIITYPYLISKKITKKLKRIIFKNIFKYNVN
jgi:glycosyltransferase involved in cell wall biosynthesis